MPAQAADLEALAALALKIKADLAGDPVPDGFDMNNIATWWPAMKQQAANNVAPKPWQDFAPGHTTDAGNNLGVPRCWTTHRMLLEAAQRGDPVVSVEGMAPAEAKKLAVMTNGLPGWPDSNGVAFRMQDWEKLGPEKCLEVTQFFWTASPFATQGKLIPSVAPFVATMGEPALEPISK